MAKSDDNYTGSLEATIRKFLAPLKDIEFKVVIRAVSGCEVLSFDASSSKNKKLLEIISRAVALAGKNSAKAGIFTARPNEAGNEIEPFVKEALRKAGLAADTPVASSGRKKAMGYPDIEITDASGQISYLECKTYNKKNVDTSQRAFYFSPSKDFKITKDAFHFLVSFQLEKEVRGGKVCFVPKHWRLYTLENLTVDLKHEFNQSNNKLYGSKSDPHSLLTEADI